VLHALLPLPGGGGLMATTLTGDEMRAMVAEHSEGEATRDWPRAAATLSDAPVYEFYPHRLRISGIDAITEAWKRLLPLPCFNSSKGGEFIGHEEYVNADSVLHVSEWIFVTPDGDRRRTKVAVRYGFEGDRMVTETMFMDASMTPFVDTAFDETFRALPGVEQI
jgi:hypothetical protein